MTKKQKKATRQEMKELLEDFVVTTGKLEPVLRRCEKQFHKLDLSSLEKLIITDSIEIFPELIRAYKEEICE